MLWGTDLNLTTPMANGKWFAGIRNKKNRGSNMGRETMLLSPDMGTRTLNGKEKKTPPLFAPKKGKLEQSQPYPLPRNTQIQRHLF
ncbi:MAG: hypothetical protein CM15mP65_24840 [Crocinitomicaceae bacterium]|nr:MAG: hypothetical protein CM15mP65_24840 [Crocinitomicaceae bacterium]